MVRTRISEHRARLIFRSLAVAALVSAFAQVTLGGIVRVTGSGLGCPDWPLCHGQLIPPFDFATLIEYSHRLSASVLGILVLAAVVLAVVHYRSNRWSMNSTLIGLALVIVASLLGGATVLTELTWWIRLIHLGIAEGVVAAMVVAVVTAWRIGNPSSPPLKSESGFNRLMVFTLTGVLILILSGSLIVGLGYGSSCGTWPLCRGSLFPEGTPYAVHMSHRYFAALIGVLVLLSALWAWKRRSDAISLGWSGLLLAIAFVVQILAGAATVWMGFTPEIKAIHLSLATLVWIALVFVAALAYVPQAFGHADAASDLRERSGMEGLAT